MTTTAQIVSDFAALFEGKDEEVSLIDMKKSLTEIFKAASSIKSKKATKKVKGENGADKPKRAPTAYNIFMKDHMKALKDDGSALTGPQKMAHIADLWKLEKAASSGSDDEVIPVVVKEIKIKKNKKDSSAV